MTLCIRISAACVRLQARSFRVSVQTRNSSYSHQRQDTGYWTPAGRRWTSWEVSDTGISKRSSSLKPGLLPGVDVQASRGWVDGILGESVSAAHLVGHRLWGRW